ncbi:MAG TPA: hypothetical protein VKQ06_01935, partial [Gammaproteobacteria bacterium]|nr:hypothetical protein [Gammaproteobacteria bacterium]
MRQSASILARGLFVVAGLAVATLSASAQSSSTETGWTLQRTPWGHPDLTGTFSSDDMRGVPLERSEEFGTRRYLTDEEFAEREENNNQQVARLEEGGTAFLAERGVRTFAQTSLIVDPPNGRMPELTPAGAARRDDLRRRRDSVPDSWLDRSLYDRCL